MSLNLLWKSNELRLMKVLPRWILPAISWVGSVRLIWGNANPYQKTSPISITMQAFEELLLLIWYILADSQCYANCFLFSRTAHFPVYCLTLRIAGCCLNFYWVLCLWRKERNHIAETMDRDSRDALFFSGASRVRTVWMPGLESYYNIAGRKRRSTKMAVELLQYNNIASAHCIYTVYL